MFIIIRKNIIDISIHLSITSLLSFAVYIFSSDIFYAALCFAGGIFIDLDHLLDYFLFYKRSLHLKDFFASAYLMSGKIYLIFHSWELCILIFSIAIYLNSAAFLVFSLSMAVHLFIDNIQRQNPLAYFLSYRIWVKFDSRKIMPEYK